MENRPVTNNTPEDTVFDELSEIPEASSQPTAEEPKTSESQQPGDIQEAESSVEFMEHGEFGRLVRKVINHPAFSFEASGLPVEYSEQQIDELYESFTQLKERVDTEQLELDIPRRIEAILADDLNSFPFNNNYQDVTARTSWGLLRGEGGNCVGFSETVCILLSMYGYAPTPVLSRLNKSGAACHYVTCFRNKEGKVEIIDPERKRSCDEVEKQYSLTAYQGSLSYAVPTPDFSRVKIGGDSGIGPSFDEYFSDKQDQVVKPITLMMQLLGRENDTMEMYEKETPSTRINLKQNSMSKRKKRLLDDVIAVALNGVYEESLAFMSGSETEW